MSGELRIAELALLGQRTLASSEDAIAQVTELVQRLSGVDITVLSEVRDGTYRFAGLEALPALTLVPGDTILFTASLCSRVHLGLAPAVVPEMRDEPALGQLARAQAGPRRRLGHPRVLHHRGAPARRQPLRHVLPAPPRAACVQRRRAGAPGSARAHRRR